MNQDTDPHESEKKDHKFRCYCGREFKLLRGSNTHRRSCFAGKKPSIAELFDDVYDIPTDNDYLKERSKQ